MVSRMREAEARKTLWLKAGELSEEERCDVLLSLAGLIEDGQNIGNGPEDILLDRDNRVQIARVRQSGRDLLFQAPELIQRQGEETPAPSPEQAWFMLGMLAYFIYCGTDYYSDRQIRVLESQEQLFSKRWVISPSEVAQIPFGNAVCQLTAVEPRERVQGLAAFLAYLSEQMPETAKIRYLCGSQVVYEEERILSQDIEDLAPGGRISLNGTIYRTASSGQVQIPYRPGTHRYDVAVTDGSSEGQNGGVRRFVHKTSTEAAHGSPPGSAWMTNRWLYVKQSHLTGDPAQGERMIQVFKLGSEDGEKQLELHMRYPDSQIFVFRKNPNGGKELVKEITILKETDAQISSCFVQLRYRASAERLWITVKGLDNTVLRRHGIDLRGVE